MYACSVQSVLEVGVDLPEPLAMKRWCGEPVKALVLPTNVFLTNRKGAGWETQLPICNENNCTVQPAILHSFIIIITPPGYPVLRQSHQDLLRQLFQVSVVV